MAMFTPVSITNNPILAMRFIQASIANSISSLYIARMRVFTLTNYVNYCIFPSLSREDEYRNLSHLFLVTIHITSPPPPFRQWAFCWPAPTHQHLTKATHTQHTLKNKNLYVHFFFNFFFPPFPPVINHFIPSKVTLP